MSKVKKKRKMYLSVLPGEQVELAVAEDGKILEYYVEVTQQAKTKGNIYKGRIHNIDVSLQAAFIVYGAKKNGFLQIDEVHPEYYLENIPHKGSKYPPIQKVLRPGMEVLVQVVKEPTGNKGAFLSTYLSIPGRYLVLTPGNEQLGVSRKIEDDKERARLKKMLDGLETEEGLGVIVRTASHGQTKADVARDFQFLKRLWKDIRDLGQKSPSPALVYEEKDLAYRSVRDYLTEDVAEIWIDHQETADQLTEYVSLVFPRKENIVKLHSDPERTLWERFNLERQIGQIYEREVSLPSGGRLVFDPTEALTAVDINSGKIGGETNFKDMVLKTNTEAAEEIAHQLMLRDIGGQIVIDFIEMRDPKHCREVEKAIRTAMKTDRARIEIGKLSRFGLMEIVRQRLGSSALSTGFETCVCCKGAGQRRSLEWQTILAVKDIYSRLRRKNCPNPLEYRAPLDLALYILNHRRGKLEKLEEEFDHKILILPEN